MSNGPLEIYPLVDIINILLGKQCFLQNKNNMFINHFLKRSFKSKFPVFLLFPVEHYSIKIGIIKYYIVFHE